MKRILALSLIILGAAILLVVLFPKSKDEEKEIAAENQNISTTKEEQLFSESINQTGLPLTLPPGFSISIFADNVPSARVLRFDANGNLWVSQNKSGIISVLEVKDGKAVNKKVILRGLEDPHGLAFDPGNPKVLYIGEEHQISKIQLDWDNNEISTYRIGSSQKIADLPSGRGHSTRTLGFGPDGRLYVSIGSSCNVCNESDARRAKIFSLNKDGSDFKEFARGLRNPVFFTWHPENKKMWATDMGRDYLGDNLPPDEINIIEEGKNYGWPLCYGNNIYDTNFNSTTRSAKNPCQDPDATPSLIDIQAHSAPLGLAFIPKENWPEDFQGDLLVAYHGSWNRSQPTGYKIVRYQLNAGGSLLEQESPEDFISGWITSSGVVTGRPVDILAHPDGAVYISDDFKGVIYKVEYGKR